MRSEINVKNTLLPPLPSFQALPLPHQQHRETGNGDSSQFIMSCFCCCSERGVLCLFQRGVPPTGDSMSQYQNCAFYTLYIWGVYIDTRWWANNNNKKTSIVFYCFHFLFPINWICHTLERKIPTALAQCLQQCLVWKRNLTVTLLQILLQFWPTEVFLHLKCPGVNRSILQTQWAHSTSKEKKSIKNSWRNWSIRGGELLDKREFCFMFSSSANIRGQSNGSSFMRRLLR